MAVGDLWHKALVYFGMADEPYDDDDDYDDEPDRRDRRAAADDLERSYRERPNVRRLGPRRREAEFDDIFADEPRTISRPPIMRPVENRPQPAEVHLVVPKSFNDAQSIADRFKESTPVILNLQSADADLSKRLIDFSSGLTYALDGTMQRVADKVFLLTPRNVDVSAEERARFVDRGFFNQS
jgi:cell division inhibitor SepF